MSQLAQIRAAIAAVIATVPNVGRVHDYERFSRDEAKFREQYVYPVPGGKPQIRGWWLRRTATRESSPHIGRTIDVHTWTVRGYLALDDAEATEQTFDELVEAIRDAVRADPGFGGLCDAGPLGDGDDTDGVQVTEAGPVVFCGVLCHSAVLQLRTWSYL